LRSEYRISYASSGTGGGRNILIEAQKDGASGLAKRLIQLQETPVIMNFESPSEGEELKGMVKLSVGFDMLNERIAGVKYSLNGEVFGESVNHPYVYNWDVSKAGPAENALLEAVCFDKNGAELARTSVTVNIPKTPVTKIIFTSPQENGDYQGSLPLEITADGNKDEIAKIIFYANGKEIGHVITEPFSYTWDISDRQEETVEIIAIAYNRENGEIDRSSLRVNILPTVIETNGEPEEKTDHTLLFVLIGAAAAAAAAAVFILIRRKNSKTAQTPQVKPHTGITPGGAGKTTFNARIPVNKPGESGFQITLEITGCEDTAMIGKVFSASRLPLTLGREFDNDLQLSEKEISVSRHHAQISEIDGEIYIQDTGSKYGTFVNNRNILNTPHPLKNDDMIKLGRSVRIKYRNSADDGNGKAAETYVGFHIPNATLVADTERSKILK
ncbi:MAG: FHA domain-containing protein, partial [Anaerolineaceae bacterium]|nr:FHA domain-containing protein [Anaerolineaceae bacterium]